MKRILIIINLLIAGGYLFAQDEAIFSHYHITPILINPAHAGFSEAQQIQFNARAQWTGFTDAPKTYQALYNGPIGNTFGLGLGVLSETAAQLTRVKVQMNYAFRFKIKEDWKFSAGFSTEFQRMQVDNEVTSSNFFQAGDDLLDELLDGKGEFDAALGFFTTFRDDTYGGLTFTNLVKSRLDDIVGSTNDETFFSHFNFLIGHKFDLIDANFSLEPSLLVRQIRNAPSQVEVNLKAGFLEDQLIAGLTYRSLGAMGILLGTKLSSFMLYYSYDISFQRFQKFNMGSHELTVAFSFKKKDKDKQKY